VKTIQSKLLLLLFVALYGFAWQLASIHWVLGLLFLSLTGLIINIPRIVQNHFAGLIILLVLVIVSTFFPLCAICIPLWGLISIVAALGMLLENWLPVLMGLILYALVLLGPFFLMTFSRLEIGGDHQFLTSCISFVIGAAIMIGSCSFMEKFGFTRRNIAYYTLGLPACICLLLIAMHGAGGDLGDVANSGDVGDSGDADGNN
jgi:hypothetical protein